MKPNRHSQSPHRQLVKSFERDWAAVAALRKATAPVSVPQLAAPEFVKSFERDWAAVAALRKTMAPVSVLQLTAPVDKLSKTLDAMWEREWDEHSEEPDRFVPIESTTDSTISGEYLAGELRQSGLPNVENVIRVLECSEKNFRDGDFNGCLNGARVVLETVATLIAQARHSNHAGNFNPAKWGEVIAWLRKSGFITKEQERGIAGVFGLLSPGCHTPIPNGEEDFARLGRNLSLSFCYFLVKRFNATEADS